jgi:hypothetical protein
MPIAKEDLKIGYTIIARAGTYVPQNVVDDNGWKDKVESDKKAHREDKSSK